MALLVLDRERPHGGVVRTLVLSRPEKRNALDPAHLGLLGEALAAAAADVRVRVVVLTAQGKAFSAGYDLTKAFDPDAPDALVVKTMAAVRACPVPTIAQVEGAAFGAGLELAISCDFRVAGDDATFCLPPAKLGIAYAPEGLARLVALVGTRQARLLAFTARVVASREALEMGLIDERVAPDTETTDEMLAGARATLSPVEARVAQLADAIADLAPLAVRLMKRTFESLTPAMDAAARASLERERVALFRSEDAAEGLAAFGARRPPDFKGR